MSATATRPQRAGTGLSRETWLVSGVVVLGAVMSILDTTIVNIALDALSRDLHAPLTTIQWASTGYLLSLAMVIPLAGWLSERFGSRRVWLVSVASFGVGSALCGLAASAEMLIGFRVLQGFGGGLIMPVGMSVLAQTAGPQRIGRVMSVIGIPPDAPGTGPRPGDRRAHRQQRLVALDLLRQRPHRGDRARPRDAHPAPGHRTRRRRPVRLGRPRPAVARARRDRLRAVGDRGPLR